MTELVKINEEVITTDDFIKILKLNGQFATLMDDIVKDKLAVHAARKQGITVSDDEIQDRFDQIRRVRGLHRAVDMNRFLDQLGASLDDFEQFIIEMIFYEKVMEQIVSDDAVEEYFTLNSPRFESIEVSHILLDSEGKAREIMAILEDDPDMFDMLAREHSIADTKEVGGHIGKVLRGALQNDVEAKVFNAEVGELLGPFASPDESYHEIFTVTAKQIPTLDEETANEVRRLIKDQWLAARAKENHLEAR